MNDSPNNRCDSSGEHVDLTDMDFEDPFNQPDPAYDVQTPVGPTSSGGFSSTGPFNVASLSSLPPPPSYDDVLAGTNTTILL